MARAKNFSNETIAALAATGKRYEVRDPLCPGLRVIVQPSGAKSFAVRFSHAGAYKKLTLGAWPQVELVETVEEKRERLARDPNSQAPDARSLYRAAMALRATGVDPSEQKKAERATARADDAERHLVKVQFQKYLDHAGMSGDRTKNEAPHVVHLADSAIQIIKAAPRFDGCDYVFSSDGRSYCSGFSKAKAALDKLAPTSKPWTLHDLRRTLSTRLAKAGVPLQVAEKILNHGRGSLSGIAGTYNRYSYADERCAALTAWAATLVRLIDGESNVVPMVRA